MSFVPRVAIDAGSQSIRATNGGAGSGIYTIPSIVVRDVSSRNVVAVGTEAVSHTLVAGEELVRPVRRGVMVDYEATVALFTHALSTVLSWWNIFQPKVVLAESLMLNKAVSQALGEAAQAAGAGGVYITPVPTLAALGADINPRESTGSLVLDIGYGSTEAAVITRGSVIEDRSLSFGGADVIAAVASYIEEKYDATVDEEVAEKILTTVGTALQHDNEKTHTFYANASDTGETCSLQVSSNEVAEAVGAPLSRIATLVADLVKGAPPTLLSDIAENGVVLTGGVANLPDIDTFISREISMSVRVGSSPQQAVIRGGRAALGFLSAYNRLVPQSED